MKPFSQACENNKAPILKQLIRILDRSRVILEIGSGTGQHGAYFAPRLPHLTWYTTDIKDNHPGISAWMADCSATNLKGPLTYEIGKDLWPGEVGEVDGVFSANTAHIMRPETTHQMFDAIGDALPVEGVFCLYGPFSYQGRHTSPSNQAFDQSLRMRGYGGVQDIDQLRTWARPKGLELIEDIAMPANNRLLVWSRN